MVSVPIWSSDTSAFNRTILELKLILKTETLGHIVAFNRTILELKPVRMQMYISVQNPLIAPYWN